jgi:hypothetical protein
MKIGKIELQTTSGEIDEIGEWLERNTKKGDLDDLIAALQGSDFGDFGEAAVAHALTGMVIGAELYRRRLTEAGNRMVQGVSEEELAQVVAMEARDAEVERLKLRIQALEQESLYLLQENNAAWDALGMGDYDGEDSLAHFVKPFALISEQREAELARYRAIEQAAKVLLNAATFALTTSGMIKGRIELEKATADARDALGGYGEHQGQGGEGK